MKLVVAVASIGADCFQECVSSWGKDVPIHVFDGTAGLLETYQHAYEALAGADVLGYVHDDVIVREENWHERIVAEFSDPTVGLVGFGGAYRHGSADLYRVPYDYRHLGRAGYSSNVDDAEIHGERFTGSTEVAVLDGFALFVRRSILAKADGWPLGTPISYIGYDQWAGFEAHRQGYAIRCVGIKCHHLGGRSFVKIKRHQDNGEHAAAHKYIYENYADVLPWAVK